MDRSIQDWVDKTLIQSDGYQPSELDDVDVAREKVGKAVDNFITWAKRWQGQHDYRRGLIKSGSLGFFKIDKQYVYDMSPPPRRGIVAQVGLGKTAMYLSRLAKLLQALRKGHCIFISTSNHKLSAELRQRLREQDVGAEIYLGPAQDDPKQPGKTMCWVSDWLEVFQHTDTANTLCKVCPHRQECGFQMQLLKKSQVWIGAHQILYRKRKKPIPPVDFVIIDEDPISAGLEGENPKHPKWLSSDDVPGDVRNAIEQLPLGKPFLRDDFLISNRRLHELVRLTLRKIQKVEISSSASEKEFKEAVVTAQANSRLIEIASFYRQILEKGPWGMRPYCINNEATGLRWVRQRKIHSDFDVPTLFADATFNEEAIENIIDVDRPPAGVDDAWIDEDGSIVPAMDQKQPVIMGPVTKIAVKTHNVAFRQVLFSGAAGLFKGENTGARNVGRVHRYIEGRSVEFRNTLVICQLELERKLHDLGLPPNIDTAHFNAIRGQDKWKDVDLLIVIGRTQPSPGAMELQAEALFRTPIKSLGPDYYDSAAPDQ